jgi:hypothetical protein
MRFIGGHILKDALNQQELYKEVFTEGIDWMQALQTLPYREVSPEEYKDISKTHPIGVQANRLQRYLRLNISKNMAI